jgi:hypothetical protein
MMAMLRIISRTPGVGAVTAKKISVWDNGKPFGKYR